jgi:ATP-binding cassette subfamily B protein
MQLKFSLPSKQRALLCLDKGEKIEYCVPSDIAPDGRLCRGRFIVVTDRRVAVVSDECRNYPYTEYSDFLCEPMTGCGLLTALCGGERVLLARVSAHHLTRLSYVAAGIAEVVANSGYVIVSKEKEPTCLKCGHAVQAADCCPHCDGKGGSFRRFLQLCKPYWWRLMLVSLIMLIVSAAQLYTQEVQQGFIDNVLRPQSGSPGEVIAFVLITVALGAVSVIATVVKNIMCARLGSRISSDLRARVFERVQQLSMAFINRRKPGELMARIQQDTMHVSEFMKHIFSEAMSNILTMVGATVLMFCINWRLALLAVAFCPMAIILPRIFHQKIFRLFRSQWRRNDRIKSRLQDVISGIRVVKSFGREQSEAARFEQLSDRLARTQSRNECFWAAFFPLLTLAMGLGLNFVTYFGGVSVLGGSMTPGTLNQFIAYSSMLYTPMRFMARLPRMLMRMLTSLERICDVLDEEDDLLSGGEAVGHRIEGEIELKDVTFGYEKYRPVLEHVDLKIKQGEMVGLVGASGTGKSTMINLIMRLYDVDKGQLLIDGVDVRDMDKDTLHSQIGVVLQETFLFSGTLLNNLRFAKPDATYAEIVSACKQANAHDFICAMPDGYNTYVSERGHNLSGGERQRIAIARAILRNPRILILDEATSSLDTESEYLIQSAIERLTEGRTTIAIAHRLSTLKHADRLVVIDRHRIAEVGTHDELMQRGGIYHDLVTVQSIMHGVEPD